MYKARITKIEKERHQSSNSDFMDVHFDVFTGSGKDEKVVATKRLAFDLDTSKATILKKVDAFCKQMVVSDQRNARNAERVAANKNFDKVQSDLVGSEIGGE